MDFLFGIFSLVTAILGSLLLLRAYLWSLAISPRDPLVRFAWKLTDWLVGPVTYLVKPVGNWDWSSLFTAVIVAVVQTLVMREVTGYPMTAAAMLATPAALLVRWAIDLLIWAVLIYAVMSFMRPSAYLAMMGTIVDPFLRPFRRVIPRIGQFDLSPIVLFLLLNLALRFVLPMSEGMLML